MCSSHDLFESWCRVELKFERRLLRGYGPAVVVGRAGGKREGGERRGALRSRSREHKSSKACDTSYVLRLRLHGKRGREIKHEYTSRRPGHFSVLITLQAKFGKNYRSRRPTVFDSLALSGKTKFRQNVQASRWPERLLKVAGNCHG